MSPAKALVDTRTGTEGIETIMWLVMRGALRENVNVIHKHYHAPISNMGAGVLVLENTFIWRTPRASAPRPA